MPYEKGGAGCARGCGAGGVRQLRLAGAAGLRARVREGATGGAGGLGGKDGGTLRAKGCGGKVGFQADERDTPTVCEADRFRFVEHQEATRLKS